MQRHERLRSARLAAGFGSAAEAARHFGWRPAAYRHHENGTSGFRSDRGAEYARAYGVSVEWLVFGVGAPAERLASGQAGSPSLQPVTRSIPMLGDVAAGLWREAEARSTGVEALRVDVQGYEGLELFALRVVGSSMDRIYPEGRWVIAARPEDVGVQDQDIVVVQRNRSGLVETTLKQLVLDGGRVALWPRSTDPAHQKPIQFETAEGDQDAPAVIGVVVADYARRERQAGRRLTSGPFFGSA